MLSKIEPRHMFTSAQSRRELSIFFAQPWTVVAVALLFLLQIVRDA